MPLSQEMKREACSELAQWRQTVGRFGPRLLSREHQVNSKEWRRGWDLHSVVPLNPRKLLILLSAKIARTADTARAGCSFGTNSFPQVRLAVKSRKRPRPPSKTGAWFSSLMGSRQDIAAVFQAVFFEGRTRLAAFRV